MPDTYRKVSNSCVRIDGEIFCHEELKEFNGKYVELDLNIKFFNPNIVGICLDDGRYIKAKIKISNKQGE